MDRESFKKYSAGHYALLNGGKTGEYLATFVEGAMVAFDYLNKIKKDKQEETKKVDPAPSSETVE